MPSTIHCCSRGPEEPRAAQERSMADDISRVSILRRKQIEQRTGYSRSTLYRHIAEGLWPRPVKIGARAVGWPAIEVAALNAARIAGRCDSEIRDLVLDLLRRRHTPTM